MATTTFTWLHISDLHYKASEKYNIGKVTRALEADLAALKAEHNLQPDVVFFTGDVVWDGDEKKYAELTTDVGAADSTCFFGRLCKAAGVGRDSVFIVPGNHDVKRRDDLRKIEAGKLSTLANNDEVQTMFKSEQAASMVGRLHDFLEFSKGWGFGLQYTEKDESPCCTKVIPIGAGLRVGILGLNSAWACGCMVLKDSPEPKDQGELFLGEHIIQAALDRVNGEKPHLVLALVHHPLDWLKQFDRDRAQQLLFGGVETGSHFIIQGHRHSSQMVVEQGAEGRRTTIAAGALWERPDDKKQHPMSYNVVRLEIDPATGKAAGKVYARTYDKDKEKWIADTSQAGAANGVLPVSADVRREAPAVSSGTGAALPPLERFLAHHGLKQNPFADRWADRDDNLPSYFVAPAWFADLKKPGQPCIVFARRGGGKSAIRCKIVSTDFPSAAEATWLAVEYTAQAMTPILEQADHDPRKLDFKSHVSAILAQAMKTLYPSDASVDEIDKNERARREIARSRMEPVEKDESLAPLCRGYVQHFRRGSPWAMVPGAATTIKDFDSNQLLDGCMAILRRAGLHGLFVLVDAIDQGDMSLDQMDGILAMMHPLLCNTDIMEVRRDLWMVFLLPREMEPALLAQAWYRRDKFRLHHLEWLPAEVERILDERISFLSDTKCSGLRALLAKPDRVAIAKALTEAAKGDVRTTLELADDLLQGHCALDPLGDVISLDTWKAVHLAWLEKHGQALAATTPSLVPSASPAASSPTPTAAPAATASPAPAATTSTAAASSLPVPAATSTAAASSPAPVTAAPSSPPTPAATPSPAPAATPAGRWPILLINENGHIILAPATGEPNDITIHIRGLRDRLLRYLFAAPAGAICKKDELKDLWPDVGDTNGVSDNSLNSAIYNLRQILHDQSNGGEYIQTFPTGYQLKPDGSGPPPAPPRKNPAQKAKRTST